LMAGEERRAHGWTLARSVLVIVSFCATWATVHSLLASRPVKRRVRERFGPRVDRWYHPAFVVFAALTLWPIIPLLLNLADRTLYVVRAPWRWLMRAGQVLAGAELLGAIAQVGFLRFFGLAQLLGLDAGDEPEALETTKFYGCVRHPMFLSGLLLFWLNPTMTVNLVAGFGMATLYFLAGTFLEERKLVRKFGDTYRQYREEMPRLIPRPGRCMRAWGMRSERNE
jgi:protein-S-isoprenylcysteine O-methyltransferase Ste14